MAGLSVAKLAAVAQMAQACSDEVLAKLARAVQAMPGADAAEFARMLACETQDRVLRGQVLMAVMPLFRPRPDGVAAPHYPAAVLTRLWKAVSTAEAALLKTYDEFDEPELAARIADRLCQSAARRLRDEPALVWPDGPPAQVERLALMFELAPLLRRSLPSLEAWVGRPDDDQIAELRLLFKDAADAAPDGAQRILDLLFAHVADAPLVLRIMALSSGVASNDEFLSSSELAGFVEGLIDATDARVLRIEAFTEKAGADAARVAAADIGWCADLLSELIATLKLQPESRWARQAAWLRGRIAKRLSALLAGAEKRLDRALPMIKVQIAGSMTRPAPDLSAAPTGPAMDEALALFTLIRDVRLTAGAFGHEGQRKQLVQAVSLRLSTYADEVIEAINGGGAGDVDRARALVERAAVFLVMLGETGPARTIRRRIAAADGQRDAERALASQDAIR